MVEPEKQAQTLFESAAQCSGCDILVLHSALVEGGHERFDATDTKFHQSQFLSAVEVVIEPSIDRFLDLATCAVVQLRQRPRRSACNPGLCDCFVALVILH